MTAANTLELPLELLKPVRVTAASPFNGFFWPNRSDLPPMLSVNWSGKGHLIHLDGPYAMKAFSPEANYPVDGLLIEDVSIVVDASSRYDPAKKGHALGAIMLKDGVAQFMALPLEDRFGDPIGVTLWGQFASGTQGLAVEFSRWKLAARIGDLTLDLWQHEAGAPR